MEIIKRGTPPTEQIYEAECRTCRSVVRFAEKEGKVTFDQRDGNFVSVTCPVCGQTIHTAVKR